jgi:hypothetical protein
MFGTILAGDRSRRAYSDFRTKNANSRPLVEPDNVPEQEYYCSDIASGPAWASADVGIPTTEAEALNYSPNWRRRLLIPTSILHANICMFDERVY